MAGRVERLVDEAAADPAVTEPLRGLLWEVGCDVVTGAIPNDEASVADWIVRRGLELGVRFVDGDVGDLAGALLGALDPETSQAQEACARLPGSGL